MNDQNTTVKSQEAVLAEKVQALVASGKSLEEALQEVITPITKARATRVTIDRIAHIKSLNNLVDLRSARKIAYAKKSKSKDKPEAIARYQEEIDVAGERLTEIIAEINKSETPWKKALEYGDTIDGAIQYWIQDEERLADEKLQALTSGYTKADVKAFIHSSKINGDFVPAELRETFIKRAQNQDQRVRTLAQKLSAINDLTKGRRKLEKVEKVEAGGEAEAKGA